MRDRCYKSYLVGGFNPSEKYSSVGMVILNIWKNKKCLKPPTSYDWKNPPFRRAEKQNRSGQVFDELYGGYTKSSNLLWLGDHSHICTYIVHKLNMYLYIYILCIYIYSMYIVCTYIYIVYIITSYIVRRYNYTMRRYGKTRIPSPRDDCGIESWFWETSKYLERYPKW